MNNMNMKMKMNMNMNNMKMKMIPIRKFENKFLISVIFLGVLNLLLTSRTVVLQEQEQLQRELKRLTVVNNDLNIINMDMNMDMDMVVSENGVAVAVSTGTGAGVSVVSDANVNANVNDDDDKDDDDDDKDDEGKAQVKSAPSSSSSSPQVKLQPNLKLSNKIQFQSNNNKDSIQLPPCIQQNTECRYDDVGDFLEATPPITNSATNINTNSNTNTNAVIHQPLPSIPQNRRIPHSKANDWNYVLERRAAMPEDGSMTALMDYNAIVFPLYKNVPKQKKNENDTNDNDTNDNGVEFELESDLDQDLLDHITGAYNPYFTETDVQRVKYLSISRTSNLHSCKPKFKFHYGTLANDFMGLSLLDEELNLIEGSDVAINVDKWLLGNMTAIFHDFQIVAVRTTNATIASDGDGDSDNDDDSNMGKKKKKKKKNQLFLIPSGHIGSFGLPIDIRRVPPRNKQSATSTTSTTSIPWNTPLQGEKYKTVPFTSQYMYGDGFEVRFLAETQWIIDNRKPHARGDAFFNRGGGFNRGKNFHFFESRSGETFMEMWPHGSHRTVPVNFIVGNTNTNSSSSGSSIDSSSGNSRETLYANDAPQVIMFPQVYFELPPDKKRGRLEAFYPNMIEGPNERQEPANSFNNKTPKHERPYKRFRGTSQIIDFVLDGQDVKLGISHTVAERHEGVTDNRAYLSQFYAFQPDPPFQIVAKSGHFCFNHMAENDVGYDAQWISHRPVSNRTAPIMIKKVEYRCPIITFAAGLSEMIGHNGENLIITYGVNDCYSRSLIVPKKKVEMLLLGKSE